MVLEFTIEHARLKCIPNNIRPCSQAQLFPASRTVGLDGFSTYVQAGDNFLEGVTVGEHFEDFIFSAAENLSAGVGLSGEQLKESFAQLGINISTTVGSGTDGTEQCSRYSS